MKHLVFLYHISNHHNTFPPLTSVQVILLPYCCIFCVLSNDMLNVSIDTFFKKKLPPTSSSRKKSAHVKLLTEKYQKREQQLKIAVLLYRITQELTFRTEFSFSIALNFFSPLSIVVTHVLYGIQEQDKYQTEATSRIPYSFRYRRRTPATDVRQTV